MPPLLDFGQGNSTACSYLYDTLINTGQMPFAFTNLKLALGNTGFTIDSASMIPLAVGERRLIKICFKSVKRGIASDTVLFGDTCSAERMVLTGSGDLADFYVTGINYAPRLPGNFVIDTVSVVLTSATRPITIDSMWLDDPIHFGPTGNGSHWVASSAKAITIDPKVSTTLPVSIAFLTTASDTAGIYQTQWHARSLQIASELGDNGIRSNTLTASVTAPALVSAPIASDQNLHLSSDGRSLIVSAGATRIELMNLLGALVLSADVQPNASVDVSTLAAGVYLYRLHIGNGLQTGKIVIP
jgi:hypothetical protein